MTRSNPRRGRRRPSSHLPSNPSHDSPSHDSPSHFDPAHDSAADALRDAADPEDGIDPRVLFRNHYRSDTPAAPGHRTLQVCSQAAEALHFALQELDDPVLQALDVVSVAPAGGVKRLTITVRPLSGAVADPDRAAEIVDRLDAAHGRLRTAVARAVRRRRAPELRFRVAAASDPNPGGEA